MNLIEVDVVGPEPFEAGVDRLDDVQARETDLVGAPSHAAADFGRDEQARATPGNRAPDQLFGFSGRVHIRGIDEVDAPIEGAMHDSIDRRLVQPADGPPQARVPAEGHRAEANL